MARARAPGKLVLSGAYSVLYGAPALVAAADRYAVADSAREASFVTAEVAEAVRRGELPRAVWFDAAALREPLAAGESRKLGLGSSAAILAASIAACRLEAGEPPAGLGERIFAGALAAHRAAQGGGSGIDVAASCYGGVLACRIDGERLDVKRHELPAGLVIEAWMCPRAASTSAMLARVRALEAADRPRFRRLVEPAMAAAEQATQAARVEDFVTAAGTQWDALALLGEAAEIHIVTGDVAALDLLARDEHARFGPSGAGGGDIALYLGARSSSPAFRERAQAEGLVLLAMRAGAPGVEADGGR